MRNTVQKDIVKSVIGDVNDHPTAEDVYDRLHSDYPRVSKATVYRILKQFADSGELTKITVLNGADCYDKNVLKHYHVQCIRCGCISDARLPYCEVLNDDEEKLGDYKVLSHDILFKAICKTCREEQ